VPTQDAQMEWLLATEERIATEPLSRAHGVLNRAILKYFVMGDG
jgi:hypothetical protein